ncbi:hypothetical protein SAMN06269185_3211 [Natronoarchaeum philippinense]|uniref:Uncharacterized protein n=1 Tax=Natronoarchaeum philippinense TaxID=558529 RepID=A0A285PDU9_NATPI|nr:hypothetical protein [Natronoarchaeum philippinense]SNZ18041.1 hypothetical protein SAMN06269185_3211 [Natronoarchaeum philippinense]
MDATPAAVRERARVEHYEPPVYGIEEPLWLATDEETGCTGAGKIEAEAVGNLLSLVATHETAAVDDAEYMKFPGEVHKKTWTGDSEGLLGRVLDRL